MKTLNLYHSLYAALLLVAALPVQAQEESADEPEAFYIYRNDGNFDGFFFDEVKSMSYSRFDLDSVLHEVYVVQDIVTEDSTYRIPLNVIDSVGFVQPDIVLGSRFHFLDDENDPYCNVRMEDYESTFFYYLPDSLQHLMPLSEDGKIIAWCPAPGTRYYGLAMGEYDEEHLLPKVGDVLCRMTYLPYYDLNRIDYLLKVKGVFKTDLMCPTVDKNVQYPYFLVYCDLVDDLADVFEQFVSVEQIHSNKEGNVKQRRLAGAKTIRRVSDSKELTLMSFTGSVPLYVYENQGKFTGNVSFNVELSMKARASYNITRKDFCVKLAFENDAAVKAQASVGGELADKEIDGSSFFDVPFYFPSFLPVLQMNPMPKPFVKVNGALSLKLSTPKFAGHVSSEVVLNKKSPYVQATCSSKLTTPKTDNSWSLELSLDGSVHTGIKMPVNIETNNWAKNIFWCSTGVDIFVGPKLSASFSLDPVALSTGDNIYGIFKGTNIGLSALTAAYEVSAKFSTGTQYEEEFKVLEGEADLYKINLNLFPSYESLETSLTPTSYRVGTHERDLQVPGNYVHTTVRPRGLTPPYYLGAAVYNDKKELLHKAYYNDKMFSFFSSYDQVEFDLPLYDGKFTVVPLINVFGYDVPAWEFKKEVSSTLGIMHEFFDEDHKWMAPGNHGTTGRWHGESGTFEIYGLMPDDVVSFVGQEPVNAYTGQFFFSEGERKADRNGNMSIQMFNWSLEYPEKSGGGTFFLKFKIHRKSGRTEDYQVGINTLFGW